MRNSRWDFDFWGRFTVQAAVTNTLLAWAATQARMGVALTMALSAVLGVITLAVWRVGQPSPELPPAGSLVQTDRRVPGRVGSSA